MSRDDVGIVCLPGKTSRSNYAGAGARKPRLRYGSLKTFIRFVRCLKNDSTSILHPPEPLLMQKSGGEHALGSSRTKQLESHAEPPRQRHWADLLSVLRVMLLWGVGIKASHAERRESCASPKCSAQGAAPRDAFFD